MDRSNEQIPFQQNGENIDNGQLKMPQEDITPQQITPGGANLMSSVSDLRASHSGALQKQLGSQLPAQANSILLSIQEARISTDVHKSNVQQAAPEKPRPIIFANNGLQALQVHQEKVLPCQSVFQVQSDGQDQLVSLNNLTYNQENLRQDSEPVNHEEVQAPNGIFNDLRQKYDDKRSQESSEFDEVAQALQQEIEQKQLGVQANKNEPSQAIQPEINQTPQDEKQISGQSREMRCEEEIVLGLSESPQKENEFDSKTIGVGSSAPVVKQDTPSHQFQAVNAGEDNQESQSLYKQQTDYVLEKQEIPELKRSSQASAVQNVDHELQLNGEKLETDSTVLGKRSRRAPTRIFDEIPDNDDNQSPQKLKKRQKSESLTEQQTQNFPDQQSSPTRTTLQQIKNQNNDLDPFSNPFINEIFKPIMASDKLQVLRKGKQDFDVLIKVSDLKVYPKEKREQLLSGYTEEDDPQLLEMQRLESLEMEEEEQLDQNEGFAQQCEEQVAKKQKRRRKKVGCLSRQAHRRIPPGSELAWISNSQRNIKLLDQQRTSDESNRQSKQKAERNSHAQLTSIKRNSSLSQPEQQDNIEVLISNPGTKEKESQESSDPQEDIIMADDQKPLIKAEEMENDPQIGTLMKLDSVIDEADDAPETKSSPQKESVLKYEQTDYVFNDRTTFLRHIDDLYIRYSQGYYHNLDELQNDLQWLVDKISRDRCKNELARIYLNHVLQASVTHLNRKKNDFTARWKSYYEAKFKSNLLNNANVSGKWYKQGAPKRQYNYIENYKVVTTADSNLDDQGPQDVKSREYHEIMRKMKTTKSSQCQGNCSCRRKSRNHNAEQVDPNCEEQKINTTVLEIEKEIECPCKAANVECGEQCGCCKEECFNRQMSLGQSLKLGQDVEERVAWGMDLYTALNLLDLRPKDMPWRVYSEFIEHRLMFAIQQQGELGWDIREALKFMIEQPMEDYNDKPLPLHQRKLALKNQDPFQFSYLEKYLAKMILCAINNLKGQNDPHFKIHSKGLGIFCKKKDGIQKDSLVVEYFGEIYPQWLWYEKQDVLKQGQNRGSLSSELPDFYNITYERHFDDPQGYDILTVDPILYGNYSSRLSHSCNPNCQTIIKVRQKDQMYSIGMFAQKDVKYGEELCFNYCSFTESEKEYEQATCLCGTGHCQGRFLQLALGQKNQGIMKEYHSFIDRNLILFNAIESVQNGDGIVEEDIIRLNKHGLKSSVFQGIPDWLKKWASLICEFIEFEQQKYPQIHLQEYIKNNAGNEENAKKEMELDLKDLKATKISNIAITIDKVQRVLSQMNTNDPPIRKLSYEEQYFALWLAEDSIKNSLLTVLKKLEKSEESEFCQELIKEAITSIKQEKTKPDQMTEDYYQLKCEQARNVFDFIAQNLRSAKSQKVAVPALCDNLMLYAKTLTYFTPTEYSKCKGTELSIRRCDVHMTTAVTNPDNTLEAQDLSKSVYKSHKEYGATYIWGQLVGWFKQTVDKPNASLSADRRGTLSMPDLDSFLITAKNQENLSAGAKRKKGRKDKDSIEEEVMPTGGTASRRGRKLQEKTETVSNKRGEYEVPQGLEPKIVYPNKKYSTRTEFLANWEQQFSKAWDVCCHWSFKNKHRLYGSIQFESVLKAGALREKRHDYFNEVVGRLREYE